MGKVRLDEVIVVWYFFVIFKMISKVCIFKRYLKGSQRLGRGPEPGATHRRLSLAKMLSGSVMVGVWRTPLPTVQYAHHSIITAVQL
eukprot:COSAG02_NODE_485_length_21365_cov_9.452584_6_plen_87_part_00